MTLQEKITSIKTEISRLLQKKPSLVVALDGRCASGKTTLAAAMEREYGYAVVHMDDFFLQPGQRTEERLAIPGENVDHERFSAEVLAPLLGGRQVIYRPFSCQTMSMGEPVMLHRATVTVVEGCYACHPSLRERYDLRVFLDVDRRIQLERIMVRNGPEGAEVFRRKWIPLEERYFSALNIPANCDLILK